MEEKKKKEKKCIQSERLQSVKDERDTLLE